MKECYLGLDYGTGGCKGCLVDKEANVLAYAYREYPILNSSDGRCEHPVHHYWQATREIIAQCKEQAGVDARDIQSIGTSAALPSLVMVDHQGAPLHDAYNLMDRRANRQEAWLKTHIGIDPIYQLSFNRLEDHPILVNLMWEKENRPQSFARLHQALTIDGYVRYLLTGQYTAHISAGIFYGVAYDMLQQRFDQDMLERIGIPAHVLPPLYRCEEIIGTVTAEAARQCGLLEGTPVAGGQVDCNAGWIGGGAIRPGDVQMNLGTCGNIGVVHNSHRFSREMFNFPYTSDCTGDYVCVSTTQTGGQTLRYLKETLGQMETAMAALTPSLDAYDYLNLEAENVPVGSEGLLMLPFLLGERTPLWDNHARGVLFGLSLHHGKGHILRAAMEGVAFALYDSFRLLRELAPMNLPLVMNEGGVKSRLWRRIITDTLGVPTVLVKNRIGAPYGDALLAAVAVGALPDFSIARQKAEYVEPMEPDPENHRKYMACFDLFQQVYQHVKEDYVRLQLLRDEVLRS